MTSSWDVSHYTGSEEDNDDIPLYDQGILFDSEPLFLPTIWNYASLLKPLSLQEESSPLFEPFSPLITLKDSFLQQETAKNSLVENLTPIEVLKQDKWNYFSSFGEKAFTLISLSKRLGFLEVVDMHTGATVYQEEITEHIEGLIEQPLWEPVSFSLIITPIGVKGIPFLLQGSGADTVNQAIKAHLLRPFYLAHLPRGYYKATIGP